MTEPTKTRPGDQPLPTVNDETDIQTLVIADIEKRRQVGIERYGTALQPFNGRDPLQDAYEEAIDLAMYLKQMMVERDRRRAMLEKIHEEDNKEVRKDMLNEWLES